MNYHKSILAVATCIALSGSLKAEPFDDEDMRIREIEWGAESRASDLENRIQDLEEKREPHTAPLWWLREQEIQAARQTQGQAGFRKRQEQLERERRWLAMNPLADRYHPEWDRDDRVDQFLGKLDSNE